ncbi:MAG: tRNA pseudouridine(55) synthase TruB [Nitrospiraceae bacterium]|nr:tRNA pseudouridine(55) synthase TruB [Nitrospiraceae bacterium]
MDLIINFNKPRGITSFQCVSKVKRLLGAGKAGHTGTLDPMATGVLLICLGEATKVSRFFLDMDKKYRARVKLGEKTDTCDAEGRVIEQRDASSVTPERIERALRMFKGEIVQTPPMYSAVKVQGTALYKLARKGLEIDRPERIVMIYHLKMILSELPYFDMEVSCSKGTYIRTLCDDIGNALGTGAHLAALERSAVGSFTIADSVGLDELATQDFRDKRKGFSSIDEALPILREVVLVEEDYERAKNGVPIKSFTINNLPVGSFVRLKTPSRKMFGIGRVESGCIRIERILNL